MQTIWSYQKTLLCTRKRLFYVYGKSFLCTRRNLCYVHGKDFVMYTERTFFLCTGRNLCYVHGRDLFMYREKSLLCTRKRLCYVHEDIFVMYTEKTWLCTQKRLCYVHGENFVMYTENANYMKLSEDFVIYTKGHGWVKNIFTNRLNMVLPLWPESKRQPIEWKYTDSSVEKLPLFIEWPSHLIYHKSPFVKKLPLFIEWPSICLRSLLSKKTSPYLLNDPLIYNRSLVKNNPYLLTLVY